MAEGEVRIGNFRFNNEKSELICTTPEGTLYRKTSNSRKFYLYNFRGETNKEKYKVISWSEASNLVRTYGTSEQWMQLFTVLDKSSSTKKSGKSSIDLDPYHRIKVQRNADRLGISMTEYVLRLIDKDDNNRNY